MINTEDMDEILAMFEHNAEHALGEYCHEGLSIDPEIVVNEQGEDVLTGRVIARICSHAVPAATREEAIQKLSEHVCAKIRSQSAPWGC